jgi:hypothetical protein
VVLNECWRLTERAIAYFIAHALLIDTIAITALLTNYISRCATTIKHAGGSSDTKSANTILNNILVCLHQLSPSSSQVARIICEFVSHDVSISLHDLFLDALVKSIQQVFMPMLR